MIKKYLSLVPLFVFIISLPCFAEPNDAKASNEKLRLAIVDLQPKGVSKVIAVAVSDLVRSDMVDTGRFIVVERNQIDAVFKEQGLQMTGCTDSSCAVEMGKLLSANKVLVGEINQLGTDILITIRIVDVGKGVAEFSTSEKANNLNEIDKSVRILVNKLTERITGLHPESEESRITGYYLRGIVPGWGQLYAGNTSKAAMYMGGFVAAGGLWAFSFTNYLDKHKSYKNLKPSDSQASFDSKYDEYNLAGNIMVVCATIWGLVYAANWVDILFFSEPPATVFGELPCGTGYIAFDVFNRNYAGVPYHQQSGFNLGIDYSVRF